MTYKTNTPNYSGRSVSNFSDFIDNIESEKEELKSVKRSINPNHDDTQKYPKNSKFKFNRITRKMDDLTISEVEDKLDNLEESLSNTVNSMSRFLEDYAAIHSPFEKRGMDEGVEIIKKSKDLEEAINKINDKIEDWQVEEKADLMPEEQRKDIIKGLKDLLANLESKKVNESHIDDDVFLKITQLESYNNLRDDFKSLVDAFSEELDNEDWFDLGDNDHALALNLALQEALNETTFY
jgi:hypothetical protein